MDRFIERSNQDLSNPWKGKFTHRDRLVAVSDTHIKSCEDDRARLLVQLVEELKITKPETFLLCGDIFDFCFGASTWFQRKFAPIGAALTELAQSGTRVVYIQGNHEFSLHRLKWSGVEFLPSEGTTFDVGEQGFACCHGDLLMAPWHYRVYLAITRSALFETLAKLVPQAPLDRFTLKLSEASRNANRELDQEKLKKSSLKWLKQTKATVGFYGHFHTPTTAMEGDIETHCFHGWYLPNAMTLSTEGARRVYL